MESLKTKIANATSRSPRSSVDLSNGTDTTPEADKYRLLITAGPSYDTASHQIVQVNTDTATLVENEFLRAKIKVRIRGYKGLPQSSPASSPYFDDALHTKDQYSIAFSFVPKQDLPSVDTVWGNDFDHPVRDRLPPGFNTAFKIVKEFIDPGLECDAYADEPWLYGPSLSCWFGFSIGDKIGEGEEIPEAEEQKDILHEGAGSKEGQEIRERHGLPENNEKRRKYFLSRQNREGFTFEKGRLYRGDFYNPYLDFGNFALKLPGFSIKVIKYIDEKSHRLRYVFKNRQSGQVYFCVNFNLLWGEQLKRALGDDGEVFQDMAGAETRGEKSRKTSEKDVKVGAAASKTRSKSNSEENIPTGDESDDRTTTGKQDSKPSVEVQKDTPQKDTESADPGLKDKPDELRDQVMKMNMTDTLLSTATDDKRDTKQTFLSEVE